MIDWAMNKLGWHREFELVSLLDSASYWRDAYQAKGDKFIDLLYDDFINRSKNKDLEDIVAEIRKDCNQAGWVKKRKKLATALLTYEKKYRKVS